MAIKKYAWYYLSILSKQNLFDNFLAYGRCLLRAAGTISYSEEADFRTNISV